MTVATHSQATAVRVQPSGVLVIDKPEGWTSHDVVAKVRRLMGTRKVGHTGTLDPMGTGILPICVGDATKVAGYAQLANKTYEVAMVLGVTTDTQDRTGQVIATTPLAKDVDWGVRVREQLAAFTGDIMQVPPMYAAVKVGGEPLYKKARRGETVERAPRPVTIHAITDVVVNLPEVRFTMACSKGTYVRALVHDVGEALGVGAHLTVLNRSECGPVTLDDTVTIERLAAAAEEGDFSGVLHSEDYLLDDLPILTVSEYTARRMVQGIVPHVSELTGNGPAGIPQGIQSPGTLCRVYGETRKFFALAEAGADPVRPIRIRRIIKTRI